MINLINTPIVDDHAHKLLTVEVIMVSISLLNFLILRFAVDGMCLPLMSLLTFILR